MKPYDDLTRLGQLRRTRQLAEAALDAYGLKRSAAQVRPIFGQHHLPC